MYLYMLKIFMLSVLNNTFFRYSGILSAYGLALADVVHESQEPCAKVYEGNN